MAYLHDDLAAGDGEGEPSGAYHERIRMIADVCHNLPGYLRARSPGKPAEGLQRVWDTASETQRSWLWRALGHHARIIAHFVDESTAFAPALPSVPRLPPSQQAAILSNRWPVRTPRFEQPLPAESRVLKAVDTQEMCALHEDAGRQRLGLGKGGPWLPAHLDPSATHYLVPDPPAYYWPNPAGKIPIRWWYCLLLLRMFDGQQVSSILAVLPERFSALPDTVPRQEQLRLFYLIRDLHYDVYLWGKDHKADCGPQRCGYSPTNTGG
jgi:hypothetical protein